MTTYLRLRALFRAVATSSLAVGVAGCGAAQQSGPAQPSDGATQPDSGPTQPSDGATQPASRPVHRDDSSDELEAPFDRAAFNAEACATGAVVPAAGVDFVAFRTQSRGGGTNAVDTPVFGASPCAAASDEAACRDAFAALPFDVSIERSGSGHFLPLVEQFVFTRRDEVGAALTREQLRALFGAIDTAYEAKWIAETSEPYLVDCNGNNARETPEGVELLMSTGPRGGGCGAGNDLVEYVVLVRPDGSTAILDSKLIQKGDPGCAIGRLTDGVSLGCANAAQSVGEHLARMASLEATAVFAFARLAGEMRAFGAPEELAQRALDASDDELHHVAMVGAQARRFGGVMHPVEARELPLRDRLEVALENAREGMVRETYGALAGTYHAAAATDPAIAAMFARIAEDETRHAALSLDFGAWIEATLSDAERAQVAELREHTASTLADEVAVELAPEVHSTLGWPRPEVARELIARAFPAAWG